MANTLEAPADGTVRVRVGFEGRRVPVTVIGGREYTAPRGAAFLVGCTRQNVQAAVSAGRLPHLSVGAEEGGRYTALLIDVEAVLAWNASREPGWRRRDPIGV